jgi:3-oxoacyl-[acyl-carrier-protein] synthase II
MVTPMRRVAITGLGLVCGLGRTLPDAWPRLMAGVHAVRPIAAYDASDHPTSVAVEVPRSWGEAGDHRRGTGLFLAAAREALADAGLPLAGESGEGIGVAAAAPVNYFRLSLLPSVWRCRTPEGGFDGARYTLAGHPPGDLARRDGDEAAALPARRFGLRGPRLVVDTACAASSQAVVAALGAIRRGRADAMLAGGGCALVQPVAMLAFARLGALTANRDPDTASRPFDRDRDGFVMGEAGAAVVLEDLAAARRRGARLYAEVCGAGLTTSATSLTDPSADGGPEADAMRLALEDARLPGTAIDYVAAHGTSTPRNDATETLALHRAFGPHAHRLAVSSLKGQLGHTLAAAGALNVIAAARAIAAGEIPPTAGYRTPDAACDLDYVPGCGRRRPVRAALANAFAFGGHNVVIALRDSSLGPRTHDQ